MQVLEDDTHLLVPSTESSEKIKKRQPELEQALEVSTFSFLL
jgi:hypothetical protein